MMPTPSDTHLLETTRARRRRPAAFARKTVVVAITAAASAGFIHIAPASAQFSNGAVIVTVPEPSESTQPQPKAKPQTTRRTPPKSTPKSQPSRRASSSPPRRAAPSVSRLKIAVLVNDDPITQYEIDQRAAMLAGGAGLNQRAQATFKNLIKQKSTNDRLRAILKETIDANRGRSREHILKIFEQRKQAYARQLQRQAISSAKRSVLPTMRRRATEELIDERLKLQAAKRANMLISDAQVDDVMKGIAKRNNLSLSAFKKQLKAQGTDVNSMRSRLRANMSWMRLVNAKFGRFVDVSQKTIDESVAETQGASRVSLHLHRLTFQLPEKLDQRIIAQRMLEADQLRAQFTGCNASRRLARSASNVVFQDLGYKIATTVGEPTRSLLINLRDGEMAPPVTTEDGVALYAVCGRRAGSNSLEARAAAERELRQKGTQLYARKHLSDLRRDAHIEYRTQ